MDELNSVMPAETAVETPAEDAANLDMAAADGMDAADGVDAADGMDAAGENTDIAANEGEALDMGAIDGSTEGDMAGVDYGDMYSEVGTESGSSFAPMSSYPFVIGMCVLALALGIGLGILTAKLKIKKGISAYED